MPITGKVKRELTMESILGCVSEYDIYRHYFGDFTLNQAECNHLRGDKSPSFIIGNKYGHIGHFDFGDPEWRGDCFSLVKKIYGLTNLNEILEKIDSDMGLGFKGVKKDYKKAISEYKQPEVTKRNTLIQIVSRPFTKDELSYWNEYYQDIQDLKKNEIYSIKKMFLNKKLFPLAEIRFGLFYNGFWKIYQPFENKKKKWLSNVPLTTSWGLENLQKDKNSLGCKSRKDYMVCRKIYPHVWGVQNESLGAFSPETVQKIRENSNITYWGGDSDIPGKKASFAITEAFGFKHINPEDRLLPEINDFAAWARKEGIKTVEQHFIKKGLIVL